MVEYIIIKAEEFATDQHKREILPVGSVVRLQADTGQRLLEAGVVELTPQAQAMLEQQRQQTENREQADQQQRTEMQSAHVREHGFNLPNPRFERLGALIHNDTLAYGVRFWNTRTNSFNNCLVTDQRQTFIDFISKNVPRQESMQILYQFGIHYNSDFEDPDFPWENEGIRKYLNEEIKNVDKIKVFNEIVACQNKAIVWSEKEKGRPEKIACKIMASYYIPLWTHYERESQVGLSTAGKTKKDTIAWHLGFNTVKITDQSQSDFYRTMDATYCWVFADNQDHMPEDRQRMINQIIETGWDKHGGYAKTRFRNPITGKFETEKKATSGFINFTSIKQLDKENYASINRTDLNYNSPRNKESLTEEEKTKYAYEYEKDPEFIETEKRLRTELRILALENWKTIRDIYYTLKTPFNGRFEDKAKPILSIAKWLGEDIYNLIVDYYARQEEQQALEIQELDDECDFYQVLSNALAEKKSSCKIPVKQLIDLWYDVNYRASEESSTKNLRYKAQKEVPRRLKEANTFTRIQLAHNATGWIITNQALEYLRLSRSYTTIDEIYSRLRNIFQAIGLPEHLRNLDNLRNQLALKSEKMTFDMLAPFFKILDERPIDLRESSEKLSELGGYLTPNG